MYPLLSKRIFSDNPNDILINFTELRAELNDYMAKEALEGSVYFEYLPTGTSIRVDGDSELVAASLMKIPVVMELYKAHELGRINMDDRVALKKEWLDARYGTLHAKGEGYQISLREASRLALVDSDNTALAAILYSTSGLLSLAENSISALDVTFDRDENKEILISARSYTSFLKCLYFSCYLKTSDSHEILQLLTESSFTSRLRSGVPSDVRLAHKIGTFSDQIQSDCGIVYVENRNYSLCVMLRSPENIQSDMHIANVSRLTYNFVSSR